jgi:hypothetical protein
MQDNRRYVRMNTVFPVEFQIAGNGGHSSERLLQGFTRDVSEGGMCLEFKSFGKETELKLTEPGTSLDLIINPTFSHQPIHALARIVWLKKHTEHAPAKYLIGVAYDRIDPAARKRLISYAKRTRWLPRFFTALALLLVGAIALLGLYSQRLSRENLKLVQELREGAEKKSEVAGELVTLAKSRGSLETELAKLRGENARLETAIRGMNDEVQQMNAQSVSLSEQFVGQKLKYENELKQSHEREQAIRVQLEQIEKNQETLRRSYQTLEEAGRKDADAVFKRMSQWLLSHRNLKTGLVASFEGDPTLEDTAFSYDQALAAQAFLLFGQREAAASVLAFYADRAKEENGAFYNAYDTIGGNPQETLIHVGPNVWIGIAALQYSRLAGDPRFVPMAERIGRWMVKHQDEEGGLSGGPGIAWYSTEHNLDAYAFFGMLHQVTGREEYARAQAAVLSWLKTYAYSNKGRTVNRGKGDSTIATDTFGWSIAALGPATLVGAELDPESIIDFVEKNCEVSVSFKQPDGQTVRVRGFDFAKAQNIGRGGVISTEWTAQMAVSYQVLARYYKQQGDLDKASRTLEKSNFYLNELQKMIITSPSRTGQGRGCLPYASADNVDTGHGWRTPKGSSTGSVAATAYGLFAWKGFNPFELSADGGERADL